MSIYPADPYIARTLEVGGLTKQQLIEKMHQQSVSLNAFAEQLLTDERFTTSAIKYSLQTVELSLKNLGFFEGATLSQVYDRVSELQLACCPLELGPYFRLIYLDQREGYLGKPTEPHQAPAGSVTIASEIISEDDDFPKGFYLRKIDGVLWLRGYTADDSHVWSPNDRFIFCKD